MSPLTSHHADDGPEISRESGGRIGLRLTAEECAHLTDLTIAYSRATGRVWTRADCLRRALTDAYGAYLLQSREARKREDEAFAAGDDSAPSQIVVAPPPCPCKQLHGDPVNWHLPRKPRKGGGTVIDYAAVRRLAEEGCPHAQHVVASMATTKKERMRDAAREAAKVPAQAEGKVPGG